MIENYKELSQIDEKYRPEINLGDKTLCIDTEDYIALYNLAEYGELLMREQGGINSSITKQIERLEDMSEFTVFTLAKSKEKIAFRLDDKRIAEVEETTIGFDKVKCTKISYRSEWDITLLNQMATLDEPGYICVEEPFEEVLNKLRIAGGDK